MNNINPTEKLRRFAKAFGLTHSRLAKMLGVSRTTVGSYFSRGNTAPSPDKVRKMLGQLSDFTGLDVPFEWFYDGQDTDPPGAKVALELARQTGIANLVVEMNAERATPTGIERLKTYRTQLVEHLQVRFLGWCIAPQRKFENPLCEEEKNGLIGHLQPYTIENIKSLGISPEFGTNTPPRNLGVALADDDAGLPLILPGDKIVIDVTTIRPNLGHVYAYRDKGQPDVVHALRLRHNGQEFKLHPINKRYDPVPFDPDERPLGLIIGTETSVAFDTTIRYSPSGLQPGWNPREDFIQDITERPGWSL